MSAVPLVGFPESGWFPGPEWVSVLLSLIFLCFCAISLTYINRRLFAVTAGVESMPLLYFLTVSAEPSSICFSEFHIVALLLPWAVYHVVRYISYEHPKPSYYFYGVLLVSSTSILVPSIVWLIPLMMFPVLFMCTDRNIKIVLMTSAGAVLPYIYLMSFMFFADRTDFLEYWAGWWSSASAAGVSFAGASLVRIFFMVSVVAVVSAASVAVFRDYGTVSGPAKRVLKFTSSFVLSLFAVRFLFNASWDKCSAPVMMMPVSFILLNYLERRHGRSSFTLPAVLVLAEVVYRISEYL